MKYAMKLISPSMVGTRTITNHFCRENDIIIVGRIAEPVESEFYGYPVVDLTTEDQLILRLKIPVKLYLIDGEIIGD